MSRVDLRRFVAWGATFALIATGAVNPFLAAPLWVPALFGLTYLSRGPDRWPALLGAPAGVGAVAVVLGAAATLFAESRTLGLALVAAGALVAVGAFVAFRRKVAARDRVGDVAVRGGDPRRRPSPRALRRFPLGFALGIFLAPFCYFWVYGNASEFSSQGEFACFEAFREEGDESVEITDESGLWPPGGKCAHHAADGTVTVRSRPVPWPEWVLLAVLAPAAGAGAWVYVRILQRASPA